MYNTTVNTVRVERKRPRTHTLRTIVLTVLATLLAVLIGLGILGAVLGSGAQSGGYGAAKTETIKTT